MLVKVLRQIRVPYCGDIPKGSIGMVLWMDKDRNQVSVKVDGIAHSALMTFNDVVEIEIVEHREVAND